MSACERAIAYAQNSGIDECESVFAKRNIITVRITDSRIIEVKQNQEEKIGIRVIRDKKIASAETRDIENYKKIIDHAIDTFRFLSPKPFWRSLPYEDRTNFEVNSTYDKKLKNITSKDASDIAQEMINSSLDKKISSITGSLNIVDEEFHIQNTNGVEESDFATYISGIINADSTLGNIPVSGIGQMSGRTRDMFSPEKIGHEAKSMCIGSINPIDCESGEYSIIFEPYSVGEMLAFVFASNFNLKVFAEKKSCFSERLGNSIAVDEFNLIDDPHAPNGIGSKKIDDEGIPTLPNPLIENGIFKNTFSDSYNAFKESTKSTGNANRPGLPMGRDADSFPISSPHNLRIKRGDTSQDEMIAETKSGILVGRLWYTYAVNPIKGDFSCTARSGIRIIKNGKIVSPAKPARIIHNLPTMLRNIAAIGNDDRNVLQWASLPSITPSIKVEKIRVVPI